MRRGTRSLYAGVLTTAGSHVIEYRRRRRLLEVVQYQGAVENFLSISRAADRLADQLESMGARDGSVAVAMAGFGSCHHLLALPPAAPDLLQPILQREMRRFFPDLWGADKESPYLESVAAGPDVPTSDSPMRDLLVAALPRDVIAELRAALGARGLRLDHVTVLAASVSRLHESYIGSEDATAVAVALPQHPVAGFFHEGVLRLFAEPPTYAREERRSAARLVTDQIERGSLYLRQQFRGARVSAIWLAAEPEDTEPIENALEGLDDGAVRQLDPGEPPGALLALGTALNAEVPDGLNLVPAELRPRSPAERWTRALGVAAAVVLLLAAGFWAGSGMRAEAAAAERLRSFQQSLTPRSANYSRIQPVIEERQAHAVRSHVLQRIITEREQIPELLWPLQDAAPTITVSSFTLNRTPDGWGGILHGTARAWTSSEASAAIDALRRALARELPPGSLTLQNLSYGEVSDPEQIPMGVAVSFQITFIVSVEEWAPA